MKGYVQCNPVYDLKDPKTPALGGAQTRAASKEGQCLTYWTNGAPKNKIKQKSWYKCSFFCIFVHGTPSCCNIIFLEKDTFSDFLLIFWATKPCDNGVFS